LNDKLVPGLKVTTIAPHSGKVPQRLSTTYSLTLPRHLNAVDKERIATFFSQPSFTVAKTRKGKTGQIDIRPLIISLVQSGPSSVDLQLLSMSATPGIKPLEALTSILDLGEDVAVAVRILKTAWQAVDDE
jgi:hypothetical protein